MTKKEMDQKIEEIEKKIKKAREIYETTKCMCDIGFSWVLCNHCAAGKIIDNTLTEINFFPTFWQE